ncbi:hypothetical protein ACRE_062700 [Hapsidospora chrysogenum ATCC 11550]|uniref:Uncharacterized protein n=1 Tax=Hapsidospora chrysogenum (strain ATCC 11550 / CBS 779.69 / DSM 880 / IAM 14645 / JCM 23072 / IMI 49137) TaxID=857340 RepID=A0A086T0T5_HAPC1|nr:hypothetical protein ACRE_062700 [Hapsidospora chrysogenum ATCC 11550]
MCFGSESRPRTNYYYHEEIILPARHDHDHHHRHHRHDHGYSPRTSYSRVTRRSYSHSPRRSSHYPRDC